MAQKRKLIEVALPLEVINRESAREKSIRHGHPSTLHLWWARRPLAAARAVLFAQLVDDPSSHPERFPTEAAQKAERERLHKIIEQIVVWENIRDRKLMAEARAEILSSTGGNPPPILDPFAGGGTIPLEAQRLGLDAHASDLNPVAVLINKALIEIPAPFADQPPVFPGLAASQLRAWHAAEGLAADVREYGGWVGAKAAAELGAMYPSIDGRTPIAWIWARSVACPNPACGIEMPLARSWWLSKKAGQEVYVVPRVVADQSRRGAQRVVFELGHDKHGPSPDGSVSGRGGASCVACGSVANLRHIKAEGLAGRMGSMLMAVVTEGVRKRNYYAAEAIQSETADVSPPTDVPDGPLATNSQYMGAPLYGMTSTASLFSARQRLALTTFGKLIREARARVVADGGSEAYADAVMTYLALTLSKMTNLSSTVTTWMSDRAAFRETFARQALPITWDFAEANPLSDSGGGWATFLDKAVKVVELLPPGHGHAEQADARHRSFDGMVVSTDPPYYDNVPYADLSDYFYVWLRWMLEPIYPELLSTLLVPKADELVANSERQRGRDGAKEFFEAGFRQVFERARASASDEYPIAVYYAFKQSDSDDDGSASSGWETLLEGMVRGGWVITATWPVRTEGSGRIRALGSNALASSIVLSLRPRPEQAVATDRPGFIAALKSELGDALEKLQAGGIAPVDLPQAAIGPGMAVFSRYSAVREFDGSQMSVRSALARINEVLDEVLSEQEGDFDPATRFCIAWFRQNGYGEGKYGDAELLGNARGIAVDTLRRQGVLHSAAGKVRLYRPADLPDGYDVVADQATSDWEGLHHLIRVLESGGVDAAGAFLARAASRADGAIHPDLLPELSHLLFRVSEDNRWVKEAISFNQLVTAWTDIHDTSRAAELTRPAAVQQGFDFDAE